VEGDEHGQFLAAKEHEEHKELSAFVFFALHSVRIVHFVEDFSGVRTALSACFFPTLTVRGQGCPRSFGCGLAALCSFAADFFVSFVWFVVKSSP
jgi:hypothetical protein